MNSRLPGVSHPEARVSKAATNRIKHIFSMSLILNKVVSAASLLQIAVVGAKEFISLRGQLLLDGGLLRGSFFHRSVVLICQHDAEGAFGLVLNRSSDNTVGRAVDEELPASLKEYPLFLGGPVQPTALSYLHSDQFLTDSNVIPNLRLGHSLEELVDIGESFSTTQKVRIFAGYAGWGAGQLEDEMKRKAWLTHPASLELVFEAEPGTLWPTVLQLKGWKYKLLALAPEDLSWN
jgi:putative transcriptional regulator